MQHQQITNITTRLRINANPRQLWC